MTAGEKLRSARLRRGLTQQQLADRLGISRASIGMMETGRNGIRMTHIKRIAEVLSIPPSYFLESDKEFNDPTLESLLLQLLRKLGYKVSLQRIKPRRGSGII